MPLVLVYLSYTNFPFLNFCLVQIFVLRIFLSWVKFTSYAKKSLCRAICDLMDFWALPGDF